MFAIVKNLVRSEAEEGGPQAGMGVRGKGRPVPCPAQHEVTRERGFQRSGFPRPLRIDSPRISIGDPTLADGILDRIVRHEIPPSVQHRYSPASISDGLKWIESSEIAYNIRGFYPMPAPDKGLAMARRVFTEHGAMLRTSEAIRLGIHPRTLYALRDSGEIESVGRGLYRFSNAPPLTSPDLVPIAIRIPRGVICLISALVHHGLTTQVPHAVDVALPSHAQAPKIDGIPLRVFWYSEPSFSAGIDVVKIDEVPVRVYSPEKTIVDCFKYRNKIGLDIAIEALRTFRERTRKPDFRKLTKFARFDRVEKIMRPYLEAIM